MIVSRRRSSSGVVLVAAKTLSKLPVVLVLLALSWSSSSSSLRYVAAVHATAASTDNQEQGDGGGETTKTLADQQQQQQQQQQKQEQQCGIYLAVSSTSTAEETKLGLYAGSDIAKTESVGSPDIAINVFNLRANAIVMDEHNHASDDDDSNDDDDDDDDDSDDDKDPDEGLEYIVDFLESYIWVPDAVGGKFELPSKGRTVTAIPGAGVAGGFNAKLTNAAWNHTYAYYRPNVGEVPGRSHPGRGAYSPYYHVGLTAVQDIAAGSEIFLDYGENWEDEESKDDLTADDYAKIDETVTKMTRFFAKHERDLDDDAKKAIYQFLVKDVMHAAVGQGKGRRVSSLLPSHPDDLHEVTEAGGSLAYSQPTVYRQVSWLKEHGLCMDHLIAGPSTIPNAGRGAFAKRSIRAGDVVVPIPLIHIPRGRSVMNMYDVQPSRGGGDGEYVRLSDDVKGQQLLLNYCLGHPESSMLFYPAGSVSNFINHRPDGREANAKLAWSDHEQLQRHETWFNLDPDELIDEEYQYVGLLMEAVATRDIAAGEEVFLDYGPEWSAAWKRHETAWTEQYKAGAIPSKWPTRAVDLNDYHRQRRFPTEEELEQQQQQQKQPQDGDASADMTYPDHVLLKAFLMVLDDSSLGTVEDPKTWGQPVNGTAFDSENLFEPVIVSYEKLIEDDENDDDSAVVSSPPPYNYTVRWSNNRGKHTYVQDVPHRAFVFVDAPGTGDQFLTDDKQPVFRHYIGIPDDIFPVGPWRDLQ